MLQELDQRSVEVELDINGELRVVHGKGDYEFDPHLGKGLKVSVVDPAGDFSLFFSEARREFQIEASRRENCDFRISVNSCTQS